MPRHRGHPLTASRPSSGSLGQSPRTKLAVICVSTVLVMAGQGIVSPVLPLYARAFDVSTVMIGATVTTFGLARLVTNIPAGMFADRRGRKTLLVGGPLVVAVGMLGSGLADSIWILLIFRSVAGFGSGLYMTGAQIYLLDIAGDHERGRFIATNQAALLVGVGLGPALGGVLAARYGLATPFLVVAAASLATAVYGYLALPETRTPKRSDPLGQTNEAPTESDPGRRHSPYAMLFTPEFFAVALMSFSIFSVRAGVRQTLVPLQLDEQFGLGVDEVGFLFTVLGVIGLALILPAGWATDRFGPRAIITPTGLLVGIGMLVVAVAGSLDLFVVGLVASAIGSSITGPAPASYVASLAPSGEHGSAMGLYRTAGDLGVVVSPIVGGWLADTYSPAVAIGAIATLVTVAALVFLPATTGGAGRLSVLSETRPGTSDQFHAS